MNERHDLNRTRSRRLVNRHPRVTHLASTLSALQLIHLGLDLGPSVRRLV